MKLPFCDVCSATEDLQRYRFVPRKEGGDVKLITLCTDCHKRAQKDIRSQAKIEDFARLACEMMRAVEALEDAFTGLVDWPEHIGKTMSVLAKAAKFIADEAREWARVSLANFNPSDLTTLSPTDLTTFGSRSLQ
jgi:hypothetical protein